METKTYCSGMRCGRKNICALWSHHLTPPFPRPINIAQYADHAGVCTKFELRSIPRVVGASPALAASYERFPEDDLPLLGPDIATQTATSFTRHVNGLMPAIKIKQVKQQKPKLTGKKIKAATKKTDGTYLVELSVLDTKFEFTHNAACEIPTSVLQNAISTLQCPDALLREFFLKKKFVLL